MQQAISPSTPMSTSSFPRNCHGANARLRSKNHSLGKKRPSWRSSMSDVGIGNPSDDGPDREVGRSERPFPLHSGGGGRAFLPEEWTPVLARRRGGRAYQEVRGSQAADPD